MVSKNEGLTVGKLSGDDHARVTAAVSAAEARTDGEIVTVVAGRSDHYGDVASLWAAAGSLLLLALLAWWPAVIELIHGLLVSGWGEAGIGSAMIIALLLAASAFLIVRVVLLWPPLLRIATPPAVRDRRVHDRAVELFRVSTERRTNGRTGILIYLSLLERRAEIVADEAIAGKVEAEVWGDIMADMLPLIAQGRVGEALAQAVESVGTVLASCLPKSENNPNELPDRLVEL